VLQAELSTQDLGPFQTALTAEDQRVVTLGPPLPFVDLLYCTAFLQLDDCRLVETGPSRGEVHSDSTWLCCVHPTVVDIVPPRRTFARQLDAIQFPPEERGRVVRGGTPSVIASQIPDTRRCACHRYCWYAAAKLCIRRVLCFLIIVDHTYVVRALCS
jgi:hypothetical protein